MSSHRLLALSAGLLLLVLGSLVASADELTVKADGAAFDELSARAGAGRLELGHRTSAAAPEFVETEIVAAQPLPASAVQAVVAARTADVQYCYEKAMARVKAPAGEVSVSFVIAPQGHPTGIRVEVPDAKLVGRAVTRGLERCVMTRVKQWRFPTNDTSTEVAIPFVFSMR